jgi:hypothetical protein
MFRRERTPAEGEGQMSPSMPTRQPWTAGEKKKLDDLLEAGKTVVEIAPVLQRTPPSNLCATTAPLQKAT